MTPDEQALRTAIDQWFSALNATIAGDPEPFSAVFSHADDVIYMSGEGTYRIGFDAAFADWKAQAARSLGGHAEPQDIRMIISGDTAAVALVSHATVTVPDGGSKEIRFRHTNVFRKEGGAWKMIVHHADNSPVWTSIVGR
jgi:uncharacterized protein (TIGR02246 family)